MKHTKQYRHLLFVSVILLAACGGGDGGGTPPPPPVSFNQFVIDEINSNTADNADATEINGITFNFDNEDATAFDQLLQ